MTRERIEDMREVVLPFVKKRLLEINYEGLGEADAEEFEKEFNAILDLAIKALEQEPTTKNDLGVDCIKKSDAIDIIQDMHGLARADVISDAVNRIITMPSVTPQEPRWIPVSERLPKENTWVLCWYEYFRYGDYECMQETYGVGFYDSYGHWGGDVSGHKSKAIAWMPLPKPYKIESEDKE